MSRNPDPLFLTSERSLDVIEVSERLQFLQILHYKTFLSLIDASSRVRLAMLSIQDALLRSHTTATTEFLKPTVPVVFEIYN